MNAFCKTIFILLFLLPGMAPAEEDIFRFDDFNWGTSFSDLPARAESHYFELKKKIVNQHLALWAASVQGDEKYRLRKEIQKECLLQLIYEGKVEGKTARITFSFTPLTRQLYNVTVKWEDDFPVTPLLEKLKKRYDPPREEFVAIGNYIWTKNNTEVEFQTDDDKTTLDYSDLKLWKTYKQERKAIRKAGEASSQNTPSGKDQ